MRFSVSYNPKLSKKFGNFFQKIYSSITKNTEESAHQILAFGIILTINYPVYYFVWLYASSQSYENIFLRLSASFFCFLLIVKNYWPKTLRKIFPFYWYATVIYSLPFFFTFMTLKNNASTMWLMNCMSVLFFLLLLFNITTVTTFLIIGISLGWVCYLLTTPSSFVFIPGVIDISGVISTFLAAFLIGSIFARNKEILQQQKLQTMKSLGETIAHELRTPLRIVSSSTAGIRKYMPQLLETYQLAKQANLAIPKIDAVHFQSLAPALDNIHSEVDASFNFINMLLINANQSNIEVSFKICSMAHCVEQALQRYPFDVRDRELVQYDVSHDFIFKGDELLTIHVLFNLLKNAIYYIKAAGKGHVAIWLEQGEQYNKLYFKDTGEGISAKVLPHIFERFFSKTQHGTGIGLAYCKLVMQSIGGDIICRSVEHEYAEFILSFPAKNLTE